MPPFDHAEASISTAGAKHAEAHGINGAREDAFSKQSESGCATQDSTMKSESVQKLLPSLEIEGMQDGQPSSKSTEEKSRESSSKSTGESSGEKGAQTRNADGSGHLGGGGSDSNSDSDQCGDDKSGKCGDSNAGTPEDMNGAAVNPGEQGQDIQPEIKNELNEAQTSDLEEKIKKMDSQDNKNMPPVKDDAPPVKDDPTKENPPSTIPPVINENQKKK